MSTSQSELIDNSSTHPRGRSWLAGFLLLGVLLGMLGSLLIGWQYHLDIDPRIIGGHFLALNGGYILAAAFSHRLLRRVPIRTVALGYCGLAFFSLAMLAVLAPPVQYGWRMLMLAVAGAAAGGLTRTLFFATEPLFQDSAAGAANRAGALFVCGCLLATIATGTTYFAGSIRTQTAFLAIIPLILLVLYWRDRSGLVMEPVNAREDLMRDTLKDLRSVATVLFSLLVFFQFGNEWAIAGWLPLFLIHRLGSNPVNAIWALAAYFLALMMGRLVAQLMLPWISHRKLLFASVAAAMFGYLLLSLTGSLLVAFLAVVIIGAGHAPIYPLIAERLDGRFSYHSGFYSGAMSIAVTGAMTTPWLLGYVDAYLGMPFVMLLPAVGSIAVLILAVLIMLEARLMGGRRQGNGAVMLGAER